MTALRPGVADLVVPGCRFVMFEAAAPERRG
jgi:hypothetical protein